MDEILRMKEEELKTELKKLQKIKEFNPNMVQSLDLDLAYGLGYVISLGLG